MAEEITGLMVQRINRAEARRFGPSYMSAYLCYKWASQFANVHVDSKLTQLTIGETPDNQCRAGEGWWVVLEDGKFETYSEKTFRGKYIPTSMNEDPYSFCGNHNAVQHRDGKEPWCGRCGKTDAGLQPTGLMSKF